jgi:hypothetical protein
LQSQERWAGHSVQLKILKHAWIDFIEDQGSAAASQPSTGPRSHS